MAARDPGRRFRFAPAPSTTGRINGLATDLADNRPTRRHERDQPAKPLYLRGMRTRTMDIIRKLIRNDKGATAIEYGLIAALIAVAAIAAMQGLGTSLQTTFNNVSSGMNS
jgi:pilus assembly protein Flp/PilA